MALPTNFSASEHLQGTVRLLYNKIVREYFNDPGDQEPDISTPDSSLLQACLIDDSDSWSMTLQRQLLFYLVLGNWDLVQEAIYSIPVSTYQEYVTFKPQIHLVFYERLADAKIAKRQQVRSELSFRLTNETATTITQADVTRFTNRIKQIFATPTFFFKRGREKYTYKDESKGYHLTAHTLNETEAKKVFNAVLDIQNHQPNWSEFLKKQTDDKNYAAIERKTILGESVKMPTRRPLATVYFKRAELKIHGVPDQLLLQNSIRR